MTTATRNGLLEVLQEAIEQVRKEKQEWETSISEIKENFEASLVQEVDRGNQEFFYREKIIQEAIDNLRKGTNGDQATEETPEPEQKKEPQYSISKEKLEAVEKYLKKHGTARQSDIYKDLGLNAGSVSVALRVLETQDPPKVIRADHKERGSQLWLHHSRVKRETVVHPGEGVSEGRRVAA